LLNAPLFSFLTICAKLWHRRGFVEKINGESIRGLAMESRRSLQQRSAPPEVEEGFFHAALIDNFDAGEEVDRRRFII